MLNTLYLPELRSMIQEGNHEELAEFCTALHPARTAEFMEGLSANEIWQVLQNTDHTTQALIIAFFDHDKQVELISSQDRAEVAAVLAEIPSDDRVDILAGVDPETTNDLLSRLPAEDRRDILRLSQFPEGTAGAMMTTDVVKLAENLTVKDALDELANQTEQFETIYYLYIVDKDGHLRGVVSARQLLGAVRKPDTKLNELTESDLVTVGAMDDQEVVADQVAKLDLMAIPVVDDEYRMMGIITYDDVIDVLHEEAVEDAHLSAAVAPLDESYLKTSLITLSWKRGIWLSILFLFALFTAIAIRHYDAGLKMWAWLIPFIPLVISSGGNSGSQSATLIITALSRGHIALSDWVRVVLRELAMGIVLGSFLAAMGLAVAFFVAPSAKDALVVPITLLLVTICGTLTGSILPLVFARLGLDPAIMSNPFVAGIIDILGIVIYLNVAYLLLDQVV